MSEILYLISTYLGDVLKKYNPKIIKFYKNLKYIPVLLLIYILGALYYKQYILMMIILIPFIPHLIFYPITLILIGKKYLKACISGFIYFMMSLALIVYIFINIFIFTLGSFETEIKNSPNLLQSPSFSFDLLKNLGIFLLTMYIIFLLYNILISLIIKNKYFYIMTNTIFKFLTAVLFTILISFSLIISNNLSSAIQNLLPDFVSTNGVILTETITRFWVQFYLTIFNSLCLTYFITFEQTKYFRDIKLSVDYLLNLMNE